jgi:hypothetical protein
MHERLTALAADPQSSAESGKLAGSIIVFKKKAKRG